MKKYNLGNIILELSIDDSIQNHERLDIYESFENIPSTEFFIISIQEHLTLPDASADYEDASCAIWINASKETRAYKRRSNPYALFFEENDNYTLVVKSDSLKAITNGRSLFNHLSLERIFLKHNAFILHSSYIIYDNCAILFSAPSGTGKSTQADLWNQYTTAEIINGDRTLIRYENSIWKAFGLPFAGSSEYWLNKSAPLKAIIFLSQSKENSLQRLKASQAIKKLYSETTINNWNPDFIDKILNLFCQLVTEIPVYSYACTKEEDAVLYLKHELFGDESHE